MLQSLFTFWQTDCTRRLYSQSLRWLAVIAGVAGISSAALAASPATVLHAESISVAFDADKSANSTTHATFDAMGRHFELELTPQTQLNAAAKNYNSTAIAFKGVLVGQPTSWVRVTRIGANTHALIWDGKELIALAPAADVFSQSSLNGAADNKLSGNADSPASNTAVFRLADTLIDPNSNTCESLANSTDGAKLYEHLHLDSNLNLDAQNKNQNRAAYRLQLSALMDNDYVHRYATRTDATNALIARLNNVDGIFTAELGVYIELQYSDVVANAGTGNLTSSTAANDLLQSLGLLRSGSSRLYNTGVTHLFTGRDLDGRAVGLAYVGAACGQRYGVSLSQIYGDTLWYDSLIVAHELGHTFGAEHDGEGECASTPTNYLMAATIGDSDRFSQCSLARMRRQMANMNCLTSLPHADFAISSLLTETRAETTKQFDWQLTVTNLGDAQATNAMVQITLPPELSLQSINGDATCTDGAGVIDCGLGSVDSRSLRTIRLKLNSTLAGSYRIEATLASDMDANATNNSGGSNVVIETPQPAAGTPPTASNHSATSSTQDESGGALSLGWLYVLSALFLLSRRRYSTRNAI